MSVIICDLVFNKAVLRSWVLSTGHFFQWVFSIPSLADGENSSLRCAYGGRRLRKMGESKKLPRDEGQGGLLPPGKCLTFAFLSCLPPSTALLQSQGKTWDAQIIGQSLWLDVQDGYYDRDPLYDCRQVIWTFRALAFSSIWCRDYNKNWFFITCTTCHVLF